MIKPFKTGLLTAILSIVALSTHADRLYVQDTNVQAGGECDLNIVLESSDMSQYSAFQFDLVLPEGFETDKNDIKYYKEYFSDSQQYFDIVQLSDVKWRIVSTSATNQRLKGQTGAIMFFRVTASASLPVGNRQGSIQNIVFTKLLANGTTQTVRMDASTYTVSVWKEASLAFDAVNKTYGDAAFTVSPKTNVSGGTITYSSGNTSVVKVSGQTFTIVGAGTAVITANQAATTNYSATSATFTVTVAQREAVLGWSNLSFTYDGNSHVPTAKVTNLVGNDVCNVTVTGAQTNVGSYTATATALSNANYKLPAANTQAFTITSASSTLSFDPVSKTYGDAAFTVTPKTNVSGGAITYSSGNTQVVMVSGQTFTVVGTGTATITAYQAATANYGASSTTFTVTVGQREAVLGWSNLGFTYDGKSHVPTATVQNLVGNDVCNVTVTGAQTNAGSYTATATALSNANYKLPAAKTNGFAVAKASLMIFGGNYVKKQGEPMPQWKAEYNGFVNGETEAVLTKQPLLSCDANENSAPGTYIVTVSGAEAQNYNISYQNGTLTITAADQIVVRAKSYTRQYGDPNPDLEYEVIGGTIQGTPQLICTATQNSPVNQYPIIVRQGTITTPNVNYENGNLTVKKAPLTITARSYTIKQGDPLPAFAAEYSGFKLNETASVLTQQPQLSCTAFDSSTPGEYPIYVYGAEAQNYDIQTIDGVLKIEAAATITVTIENCSREYGDPNPAQWKYSVSGGTLQGEPAFECDATQRSAVGQYEIRGSRGTVTNPNVQFVSGWLTVNKAPLKVIADSYTINQGDPLPEFTAHYDGFKLGETASVLTQQPQLSCTAYDSSTPGEYPIYVYGSEARNYAIEEVDGVLTIVAAPQEPELVLTELYVDGDNHEAGQHTIHYTIRNYGGDFNDYVYIFLKVPGIDEVVKSGDFWSIPSKKELRVSKPATLTVFGTYHIWVATDADGQNILGETEWTLLQPEEEKGYTLVVKLNDGSEEKYVLKERPEAWMQGTRLRIESTTMSTAYERTDIEKFYFLDKDGNPSGIKAVAEAETSLTVRQLSNGRLQVSGLADDDAVRVFDLSGRLLTTVKSDGSNSLSIDLSQQPKGVYIININNKRTIKLQVR